MRVNNLFTAKSKFDWNPKTLESWSVRQNLKVWPHKWKHANGFNIFVMALQSLFSCIKNIYIWQWKSYFAELKRFPRNAQTNKQTNKQTKTCWSNNYLYWEVTWVVVIVFVRKNPYSLFRFRPTIAVLEHGHYQPLRKGRRSVSLWKTRDTKKYLIDWLIEWMLIDWMKDILS